MKFNIRIISSLFGLIVILLCSCNRYSSTKENNVTNIENNIIKIDARNYKDLNFTLSKIGEDIKYISLSNDILLSKISNLKFVENEIYLINSDSLLIKYDSKGQNPIRIGKYGRGPNEHTFISTYAVDNNSGSIYTVKGRNTVQIYSQEGDFRKAINLEKTINSRINDIEFLNSSLLLAGYVGPKELKYNWVIMDTIGNIKSYKINTTVSSSSQQGGGGGLFKYKEAINIWDFYSDTIYRILPNSNFYPIGYFVPGEHRQMDKDVMFTSPMQAVEAWNKLCATKSIIETNKYLIYNYSFNGKQGAAFIDKSDNTVYSCLNGASSNGIINDLDNGVGFYPECQFEKDGNEYLAGIVQPIELKAHVASEKFKNSTPKYPEKKKQLEQLANSLDENDNPVLMLVKLKK